MHLYFSHIAVEINKKDNLTLAGLPRKDTFQTLNKPSRTCGIE